jgi:hypothetical protein
MGTSMAAFRRSFLAIKLPLPLRAAFPVRSMSYTSHWSPGQYPPTRRSDHVDVYASKKQGKVSVQDPYEWLQHDTKETQDWVSAQEEYTRKFLDAGPDRHRLEMEIKASTDYERVSFRPRAFSYAAMVNRL